MRHRNADGLFLETGCNQAYYTSRCCHLANQYVKLLQKSVLSSFLIWLVFVICHLTDHFLVLRFLIVLQQFCTFSLALSILLGRVALVAQRPIVVKLSRGRSVGLYVRRYVQCIVENGGLDPDAVWHHRSNGSKDKAGTGVWQSVHGKGYFSGRIWARHCNQWGLYGVRV